MFNTYQNDTRGNVAIMFALVILGILASVGAAVDLTAINAKRTSYQAMADAAVLAAARSGELTQDKLQAVANEFIDGNNVAGETLASKVVLGQNDRLSVQLTGEHKMWFMGMFGKKETDIQVIAEAPMSSSQAVNIALVLDVTGSMKGTKIAYLRTSATGLVSKLEGLDSGSVKISVVPFARYVKLPASYAQKSWLKLSKSDAKSWNGCVGSRTYPYNDQADFKGKKIPAVMSNQCQSEILPLTDNFTEIKSKINGLQAGGWTYMPSGLVWGWRTLSPSKPFNQAKSASKNTKNVMIVMSDGANTVYADATGNHVVGNDPSANTLAAELCTNINDANIDIFTIAYDLNNVTAKNLLKNCATSSDMFFDASNAAELEAVFQDIGNRLAKIRLTH